MRNQIRKLVQYHVGEVSTIVQDHVQGLVAASEKQGLFDTPVCFLDALSFPGKNANACSSNCRGSMVLGREDVARAPFHLCAQGNQGFNQYGSLNGHVQTTCNPCALQRLGCTIFFTKGHQTGHFCLSEPDFFSSPFCEGNIRNLVRQCKVELCDSRHVL